MNYNATDLAALTVKNLRAIAKEHGVKQNQPKADLIAAIVEATKPAIDLSNLSNGAIVVLSALVGSCEDTGGDFGWMDEAYGYLDGDIISKHAFAGYVNALNDFIEWTDDTSADPGLDCDGIQFKVTDETYNAREVIHAAAKAIEDGSALANVEANAAEAAAVVHTAKVIASKAPSNEGDRTRKDGTAYTNKTVRIEEDAQEEAIALVVATLNTQPTIKDLATVIATVAGITVTGAKGRIATQRKNGVLIVASYDEGINGKVYLSAAHVGTDAAAKALLKIRAAKSHPSAVANAA